MANFSDLKSSIDYHIEEENHVARIDYTYNNAYVGSAYVNLSEYAESIYQFEIIKASGESEDNNKNITTEETGKSESEKSTASASTLQAEKSDDIIFINVKTVLIGLLIFAAFFICFFIIRALIINSNNSKRRKNRVDRKKHRRERIRSNFDDFDF